MPYLHQREEWQRAWPAEREHAQERNQQTHDRCDHQALSDKQNEQCEQDSHCDPRPRTLPHRSTNRTASHANSGSTQTHLCPSEDVLCNELRNPTMAQRAGYRDKGLQRTELFILQTQYELDFRQDRAFFFGDTIISMRNLGQQKQTFQARRVVEKCKWNQIFAQPAIVKELGMRLPCFHPFDPAQIKQPIQHLDRVFV